MATSKIDKNITPALVQKMYKTMNLVEISIELGVSINAISRMNRGTRTTTMIPERADKLCTCCHKNLIKKGNRFLCDSCARRHSTASMEEGAIYA